MTHRSDRLLIAAACMLTAAGGYISVPLGLASAGVVLAALWWLLGDA